MPDDLKDRGKPDRDRVNVHEKWELDRWSKEFGVTPERLKEAEKKVGRWSRTLGGN